jgi:DNA polymerase III alpha subunit
MAFIREEMTKRGILSADQARYLKKRDIASVAGAVIIRQRPMTANNVVFITLEDETGFSNFVVMPDMFERFRAVINQSSFLIIRGIWEERGMMKALHFTPLTDLRTEVVSHNFDDMDADSAIAIVDCNNFYASCERVVNPELQNRPVVVLSHNDGIIVSRSNEVKGPLASRTASPFFQHRELLERTTRVISCNHALYYEFSHRVMDCLN